MIKEILLLTASNKNLNSEVPLQTAETFYFLNEYIKTCNLSMEIFFKELALLDVFLRRCEKDEQFFWSHRYEALRPLRYLLKSPYKSDTFIFLRECSDVTIRVIHLLNKNRSWISDTNKINEDENFLKMQAELLTRFTYILTTTNEDDVDDWDIDDLPCSRCCFCTLHYTIEDLIKKAMEIED